MFKHVYCAIFFFEEGDGLVRGTPQTSWLGKAIGTSPFGPVISSKRNRLEKLHAYGTKHAHVLGHIVVESISPKDQASRWSSRDTVDNTKAFVFVTSTPVLFSWPTTKVLLECCSSSTL